MFFSNAKGGGRKAVLYLHLSFKTAAPPLHQRLIFIGAEMKCLEMTEMKNICHVKSKEIRIPSRVCRYWPRRNIRLLTSEKSQKINVDFCL